ncbi:MAG: molybdenum ABC transporter ATP-binding protein [Rhizobiales bacterium PAR1]|nr:MAG: molybdenum ABC transporter ATP-binding protein [Rhizobiales bacterium PAR1]
MMRFAARLTRPGFILDADFEAGEGITALFGPSGSGKSTILRIIAGLQQVDSGKIQLGEHAVLDTTRGLCTPPHRRRVGFVFQEAQLLPHLRVSANLTYGRWFTPRDERRIAFDAVVEVLGIGHLLARPVSALSGGEKQRVAIGRALLTSPHLLLMDEPLASLDHARKQEILPFIERLRDEFAIPILYVSHAAEEVARLASRVVRLEAGRVTGIGAPGELLAGQGSEGRIEPVSVLVGQSAAPIPSYAATRVEHPAGAIILPGAVTVSTSGIRVAIRASQVTLVLGEVPRTSVRTVLEGEIETIEPAHQPFVLVGVRLKGGDRLFASITQMALDDLALTTGMAVLALVKTASLDETGIQGHHAGAAGRA